MDSYLNKEKDIPFSQWTKSIAINSIIDEFRKNKRYQEQFLPEGDFIDEDQHPLIDQLESKEKMEVIEKAIEQLPEMNRMVFNLYVIDGYKHEEIAGRLNISSNTSKAHLHQAREKLKKLLAGEWNKNIHTTSTL